MRCGTGTKVLAKCIQSTTECHGTQVAKLLGEKWRSLDAEGKAEYQAAAAEQAAAMKEQQQHPSAAAADGDKDPEVFFLTLSCKCNGT